VRDLEEGPSPAQAPYQHKRPARPQSENLFHPLRKSPALRAASPLVTGPSDRVGSQTKSRRKAYRNLLDELVGTAEQIGPFQTESCRMTCRNFADDPGPRALLLTFLFQTK